IVNRLTQSPRFKTLKIILGDCGEVFSGLSISYFLIIKTVFSLRLKMIEAKNDTFTFGPFLLDVKERVLLRGSKPVSLTPKVFATLLMLVEKAGHIVEKEELISALWPNTYVDEANIAQNIFKLRKVLGKNRVGKTYIETVPRRGYRFLAIVNRSPDLTVDPNVRPPNKAPKELLENEVDRESRTIKSIAV